MMETNLDKVLSLHIESLQCIAGNDLSVLLMLHAGSMLRCLCSVESWQPAGLQAVWQHVGEVMQHYGHTVPGQPQLCQQIFLEMFKIIWLHVRCKYFLCDNSCTLEPVLWQEPGGGRWEVGGPPGLRTGALTSHLPPPYSHTTSLYQPQNIVQQFIGIIKCEMCEVWQCEREYRGEESAVLASCYVTGLALPGLAVVLLSCNKLEMISSVVRHSPPAPHVRRKVGNSTQSNIDLISCKEIQNNK